jgi:hypothetical protein
MMRSALALQQLKADVIAKGGTADDPKILAFEKALQSQIFSGKGDSFDKVLEGGIQGLSPEYLKQLRDAVNFGMKDVEMQMKAVVREGHGRESSDNISSVVGEMVTNAFRAAGLRAKQEAEQSRKLLDQKLGTMTKDEDKKAELEETFAGRTADDRKFLARARASDPSMTKSKTDAEKQNLQTSIAGLKTANQNIATALKKLPGSPDTPNLVQATGKFEQFVDAGNSPGSIYTHDTHVEAALVSTNGLLADILSAVQGSGGKSSNGNGGGGWASLASAMETFNPSATALTTSLNAFNTNFAGGMKWTLESKHTIKLDGIDGLAIFSSLEGAFSSLVVDTVEALITEQLDERLPQLTKKAKQKPMGTNE